MIMSLMPVTFAVPLYHNTFYAVMGQSLAQGLTTEMT